MEELINELIKIKPMSAELIDRLQRAIRDERFKKKVLVLREGSVGRKIWFITKGLVRIYRYVGDNQVTYWILKEGDFMIADGFFIKAITTDNIEVIEEVVLHYITLEELEAICTEFPEFLTHYHWINAKYRTIESKRATLLRGSDAYVRFEEFMEREGDLLQRVPRPILLSYLSMNPKTFGKCWKKWNVKSNRQSYTNKQY